MQRLDLSKVFKIIAGAVSIGAGLYLAGTTAQGSNSMLQVLANGIGWYCIGRGIFMIASSGTPLVSIISSGPHIDDTQECKSCKSMVHKFASKCRNCGSDLNRD